MVIIASEEKLLPVDHGLVAALVEMRRRTQSRAIWIRNASNLIFIISYPLYPRLLTNQFINPEVSQ